MNFNRTDVKISFEKPVFYINEEKKTVVCTLKYRVKSPLYEEDMFRTRDKKDNRPFYFLGMGEFEGEVCAKAKCHADDKFDAKIGTEIAYARAENMAYSEALNYVVECNDGLMQLRSMFAEFEIKCRNHNSHNKQYIKELGEK
jgi:hypothetical protein